jgi:hypothetical protein
MRRTITSCALACIWLTACTVGIARRDEFLPEAAATSTATPLPTVTEITIPPPTETQIPTPVDTALPTDTDTPPPPSSTPAPTFTPPPAAPTSPPPTSTPTETPSPTPCSIDIGPAFQPKLSEGIIITSTLGCPITEQQQTQAAEQPFQHGRMFWRSDTDQVYVLYNDSRTFQIESDPHVEGDPEDACPEIGVAPPGLVKPVRGFNRQWCNIPGVRDTLGWGLESERAYETTWQEFGLGHVIMSRAAHIFVLYDGGSWQYIE